MQCKYLMDSFISAADYPHTYTWCPLKNEKIPMENVDAWKMLIIQSLRITFCEWKIKKQMTTWPKFKANIHLPSKLWSQNFSEINFIY